MKKILNLFAKNKEPVSILGFALISVALYIGTVAASSEPGLPLDDGWIHQTYARNLVRSGRWEFVPGTISAGSTSPLWTVLLAVGYLLHLPPLPWAYLLGWLSLVWVGYNGTRLWQILWPERERTAWVGGGVLVLTWPLVWAAGSGMETLLFMALGLHVLGKYCLLLLSHPKHQSSNSRDISKIGLSLGLLVLTRPDGLGLFLLILLGLTLSRRSKWRLSKTASLLVLGSAVPLIPYFALNLWASGSIWPNTFYAKQAEYAFLWERPLLLRFSQLLLFSLGGPAEGWRGVSSAHLLLLPGVVVASWRACWKDWTARRLLYTLPLLWSGGHVLLYAWRLPVTYQHGRYLWPALSIWILYGLAGWQQLSDELLTRFAHEPRRSFLWRWVTSLTFALLLLVFLFLGARAYNQDVAFINGEMVEVANWLRHNTPENALIAAHDIGAIGYYAERPLLDLAGLISPGVIPLLSSEEALARYVRTSQAEYLVTAPGWPYRTLTGDDRARLVHTSDYTWTQEQGLNNTAVYRLERH